MKSALKIMEKNLRKLTLILICLSKKSKCLFCSVDCNLKRHLQSSEKCSKNYIDKFEKPNGKTIVNVGIRDITILKVVMDWLTKFGFSFFDNLLNKLNALQLQIIFDLNVKLKDKQTVTEVINTEKPRLVDRVTYQR